MCLSGFCWMPLLTVTSLSQQMIESSLPSFTGFCTDSSHMAVPSLQILRWGRFRLMMEKIFYGRKDLTTLSPLLLLSPDPIAPLSFETKTKTERGPKGWLLWMDCCKHYILHFRNKILKLTLTLPWPLFGPYKIHDFRKLNNTSMQYFRVWPILQY